MAVNHWDLKKRKASGGKKRAYRTKRNYETGSFPSETRLGELRKKVKRGTGYLSRMLIGRYEQCGDVRMH